MSYIKIQKALDAGLFSNEMCEIIAPPSMEEIDAYSISTRNVLIGAHVELLLSWGGSNLDEIRIKGLEDITSSALGVVFADDYNGYIYSYKSNGKIIALDTDGGKIIPLADSLDDFINDVFLGTKGEDFYGKDWTDELRNHGIT